MSNIETVQLAYTTILKHFISNGLAPHFTELARIMNISPDEARDLQVETAEEGVGCWLVQNTDYIEGWAPFYNVPNQHQLTVNGEQKWYCECGIEALAVHWLFPGKDVTINTTCLDCGEPIKIMYRNGEILDINPSRAVGHMNNSLAAVDEHTSASFF